MKKAKDKKSETEANEIVFEVPQKDYEDGSSAVGRTDDMPSAAVQVEAGGSLRVILSED